MARKLVHVGKDVRTEDELPKEETKPAGKCETCQSWHFLYALPIEQRIGNCGKNVKPLTGADFSCQKWEEREKKK
jgi:hypothetical protein